MLCLSALCQFEWLVPVSQNVGSVSGSVRISSSYDTLGTWVSDQLTIELFLCVVVCVDVCTGGYVVFVCLLVSINFSLSNYLSQYLQACVYVCLCTLDISSFLVYRERQRSSV